MFGQSIALSLTLSCLWVLLLIGGSYSQKASSNVPCGAGGYVITDGGSYSYSCQTPRVVTISTCNSSSSTSSSSGSVNISFATPFQQLIVVSSSSLRTSGSCDVEVHLLFSYMETSKDALGATAKSAVSVISPTNSRFPFYDRSSSLSLYVHPQTLLNITEVSFLVVNVTTSYFGVNVFCSGTVYINPTAVAAASSNIAFVDLVRLSTTMNVEFSAGSHLIITGGNDSAVSAPSAIGVRAASMCTITVTQCHLQITGITAMMASIGNTRVFLFMSSSFVTLMNFAILMELSSQWYSPSLYIMSSTITALQSGPLLICSHTSSPTMSLSRSSVVFEPPNVNSSSPLIAHNRSSGAVFIFSNRTTTVGGASSLFTFNFYVYSSNVSIGTSSPWDGNCCSLVMVRNADTASSVLLLSGSRLIIQTVRTTNAVLLDSAMSSCQSVAVEIIDNSLVAVKTALAYSPVPAAALFACGNTTSTGKMSSFSVFDSIINATIRSFPKYSLVNLGDTCSLVNIQLHNSQLLSFYSNSFLYSGGTIVACGATTVSSSVMLLSNVTLTGWDAVIQTPSLGGGWVNNSVLVILNCSGPSTWCAYMSSPSSCRNFARADLGQQTFSSTLTLDSVTNPGQCQQFIRASSSSSASITSCTEPIIFAGGTITTDAFAPELDCTIVVASCLPNRDGSLISSFSIQPNTSLVIRHEYPMWNLSLCSVSVKVVAADYTSSGGDPTAILYDVFPSHPLITLNATVASFSVNFANVNMSLLSPDTVWCLVHRLPSLASLSLDANAFVQVSNGSQLLYAAGASCSNPLRCVPHDQSLSMTVAKDASLTITDTSALIVPASVDLNVYMYQSVISVTTHTSGSPPMPTSLADCGDVTTLFCISDNVSDAVTVISVTYDRVTMFLGGSSSLLHVQREPDASVVLQFSVSGSILTFQGLHATLIQSSCSVGGSKDQSSYFAVDSSTFRVMSDTSASPHVNDVVAALLLAATAPLDINGSAAARLDVFLTQNVFIGYPRDNVHDSVVLIELPNMDSTTMTITIDNCSFQYLSAIVATNVTTWNAVGVSTTVIQFSGCTSTWCQERLMPAPSSSSPLCLRFLPMNASLFAVDDSLVGVTAEPFGVYAAGTAGSDCPVIPVVPGGTIDCSATDPIILRYSGVYTILCTGSSSGVELRIASCLSLNSSGTSGTDGNRSPNATIAIHVFSAATANIAPFDETTSAAAAQIAACSVAVTINQDGGSANIAVKDMTLTSVSMLLESDVKDTSFLSCILSNLTISGVMVINASLVTIDASAGTLFDIQSCTVAHLIFENINTTLINQALRYFQPFSSVLATDSASSICNITVSLSEVIIDVEGLGDADNPIFHFAAEPPPSSLCATMLLLYRSSFTSVGASFLRLDTTDVVVLVFLLNTSVTTSGAPFIQVENRDMRVIGVTVEEGSTLELHGGALLSIPESTATASNISNIDNISIVVQDAVVEAVESDVSVLQFNGVHIGSMTLLIDNTSINATHVNFGFLSVAGNAAADTLTIRMRSVGIEHSGSRLALFSTPHPTNSVHVSFSGVNVNATSVDALTLLSIVQGRLSDCSVAVEKLHILVNAVSPGTWASSLFEWVDVEVRNVRIAMSNSTFQFRLDDVNTPDTTNLVIDIQGDSGTLAAAVIEWNNVSVAVSSTATQDNQSLAVLGTNTSFLSNVSWSVHHCAFSSKANGREVSASLWSLDNSSGCCHEHLRVFVEHTECIDMTSVLYYVDPLLSPFLSLALGCSNTWCLSNTSTCVAPLTTSALGQRLDIVSNIDPQGVVLADGCFNPSTHSIAKQQVSTGSATRSQQISSRTVTLSSSNIHSRSLRELQTASFAGTPSLNSLTLPSTHTRAPSTTITLPLPPLPPPPSAPVALQAVTMVVIGPLSGAFLAAPVAGLVQRSALAVRFSLCSSPSSSTAAAVASDDDDDASSPMNSPTQMKIGSSPGSAKRGAVIGNIVLLGALALLVAVFGLVRRRALGSVQAATAQIGCPGRLYIAYALLLQPTVTASMALLTTGNAGNVVLGLFGLVAMLAVVGYVVYAVHVGCRDLVRGVPNPSNGSILDTLAGRRILWKSTSRTPDDPQDRGRLFSSQYDTLIGKYIPGRTVFFATGALWSVLTGCTGALSPSSTSQCHAAQWMLLAISLLSLGSLVALRPFASRLDFAVNLALEALSAVSSVLSLTSVDGGSQSVSYTQIGLAGLLSVVKFGSRVWLFTATCLSPKSTKDVAEVEDLDACLVLDDMSNSPDRSHRRSEEMKRKHMSQVNSVGRVLEDIYALANIKCNDASASRRMRREAADDLLAALLVDAETASQPSSRRALRRLQGVISIVCALSSAPDKK